GILIAVDAIPDLFATVTNATGDLAAATLVARFLPRAFGAAVADSDCGGPEAQGPSDQSVAQGK
ncbi:MAG TPA: hypothetical protein VI756_24780, partial [Blastocatellia bacterium]